MFLAATCTLTATYTQVQGKTSKLEAVFAYVPMMQQARDINADYVRIMITSLQTGFQCDAISNKSSEHEMMLNVH